VSADHSFHETRVTEAIEAALLAVALSGRVNERQVARTADPVGIVPGRIQETVLERDRDVLGETNADEARRCDGVTAPDQRDRVARTDDFATLERMQCCHQIGDVGCVHAFPGLDSRTAASVFKRFRPERRRCRDYTMPKR